MCIRDSLFTAKLGFSNYQQPVRHATEEGGDHQNPDQTHRRDEEDEVYGNRSTVGDHEGNQNPHDEHGDDDAHIVASLTLPDRRSDRVLLRRPLWHTLHVGHNRLPSMVGPIDSTSGSPTRQGPLPIRPGSDQVKRRVAWWAKSTIG